MVKILPTYFLIIALSLNTKGLRGEVRQSPFFTLLSTEYFERRILGLAFDFKNCLYVHAVRNDANYQNFAVLFAVKDNMAAMPMATVTIAYFITFSPHIWHIGKLLKTSFIRCWNCWGSCLTTNLRNTAIIVGCG